jgi:hypothetical protein
MEILQATFTNDTFLGICGLDAVRAALHALQPLLLQARAISGHIFKFGYNGTAFLY